MGDLFSIGQKFVGLRRHKVLMVMITMMMMMMMTKTTIMTSTTVSIVALANEE